MNLLHLATTNEGGAGMVCTKSHELFLQRGYNSLLVVKESGKQKDHVVVFKKLPAPGSFLFRVSGWMQRINQIYRKFFPFTVNPNYSFYGLSERKKHYSAKKILSKVPFKPDAILIYWVSEFINAKTIKDLADMTGAKLCWFMTDNAPITGGCHYPWQCTGYQSDCSGCPGILTPSKKNIPKKNLLFKKNNLPLHVELFVGSESDYRRATSSLLFKERKVRRIFAPVDEKKFVPGSQEMARKHFGIEPGVKVIFYGASEFKYLRKGGKYFVDALGLLSQRLKKANIDKTGRVLLLIAGKDWQQYFSGVEFPLKDVGYLSEDDLVKAFQASDFFVSPSLEDSGPAMVVQSIMCGTPVLAFGTGIALDIVRTGETGYLAELFKTEDLASGLEYMLSLNEAESNQMRANCRKLALSKFTLDIFYQTIVDSIK